MIEIQIVLGSALFIMLTCMLLSECFFMIETDDCNLTLQTFFWKGGGVYWLVIESSAAVNLDNFID